MVHPTQGTVGQAADNFQVEFRIRTLTRFAPFDKLCFQAWQVIDDYLGGQVNFLVLGPQAFWEGVAMFAQINAVWVFFQLLECQAIFVERALYWRDRGLFRESV